MTNQARWCVVTAGMLALAGCGGGGGDDAAPVTLATITTTNAPEITSSVMSASLQGGELASFASLSPQSGGPTPLAAYSTVAAIQSAGLEALRKHAQAVAHVPFGPEVTQCTDGGTATISGNVANPLAPGPNDTIVVEFAACIEGDTTMNGRLSMRITSLSGNFDTETYAFGVDLQLVTFQVTVAGETSTANGSIGVAVNSNAATQTTTVTSSSITISEGGSSHTLRDYSSTRIVSAGAYTLDVGGSLTSTDFSGTVTFDTTTLLQGLEGEHPFAGQMLISGAGGATVKVRVLDSTFVRLEVDSNGDGTVDATLDRAWSDLI
jgi:hypothetical protein